MEFNPKGQIDPRRCIQEVSFISLSQLSVTLSMGMNEKSLIECPGELKCSETVVMFYIKFMFVRSLTAFLLSLSDILYVVMRLITTEEAHVKFSLTLKLAETRLC